MSNLESAIHWRQWTVAIVLALFIAVFSLSQFHMLQISFFIELGCLVLLVSAGWNVFLMILARNRRKPGWNGEIADGLLITGLIMVFFGAFF
jgi:hypothetical protein